MGSKKSAVIIFSGKVHNSIFTTSESAYAAESNNNAWFTFNKLQWHGFTSSGASGEKKQKVRWEKQPRKRPIWDNTTYLNTEAKKFSVCISFPNQIWKYFAHKKFLDWKYTLSRMVVGEE